VELREVETEMECLTTRDPEIDFALQKICMDMENSKRRIVEAERRVKELRFVELLLSRPFANNVRLLAHKINRILVTLHGSQISNGESPPE
jgi:hypothetical protein